MSASRGHDRRGRPARRAAERGGGGSDGREGRVRRRALGRGPPGHRGHGVRLAEGDSAAGRRRRGVPPDREAPGGPLPGPRAERDGARPGGASGVREIAVFTAASETFNRKNINASIDESFGRFAPVIRRARTAGSGCAATSRAVFGCPYEGASRRLGRARRAAAARRGLRRGLPRRHDRRRRSHAGARGRRTLRRRGRALARLALHFHDTRGTALANVAEGLRQGVRIFDSSAGGLGGCPYAPGAAGNVATEDLVYLLHGHGLRDRRRPVSRHGREPGPVRRNRAAPGLPRLSGSRVCPLAAGGVNSADTWPCEEIECPIGFSWQTTV